MTPERETKSLAKYRRDLERRGLIKHTPRHRDVDYCEEQLHIIQNKTTLDALNRYRSALHSVANIKPYIKEKLHQACDTRAAQLDIRTSLIVEAEIRPGEIA